MSQGDDLAARRARRAHATADSTADRTEKVLMRALAGTEEVASRDILLVCSLLANKRSRNIYKIEYTHTHVKFRARARKIVYNIYRKIICKI